MELDPRFLQGLALKKMERFEDAAEFWGDLLQQEAAGEGGEMATRLAPLYFEYGNALLSKAETTEGLFGEALQEAQAKKVKEAEEEQEQEQGEGTEEEQVANAAEGAEETKGEAEQEAAAASVPGESDLSAAADEMIAKAVAAQEEAAEASSALEEDLQVAWECLDVARALWSQDGDAEAPLKLAKAHLRLGDLSLLNGNYAIAVDDFTHCLKIREAHCPPNSRSLADVHYSLAQAYLYAANAEDTKREAGDAHEDAEDLRAKSLKHYETTAEIFQALVTQVAAEEQGKLSSDEPEEKGKGKKDITSESAGDSSDLKELKAILIELQETIETAKVRAHFPPSPCACERLAWPPDDCSYVPMCRKISASSKRNGSIRGTRRSASSQAPAPLLQRSLQLCFP
jgi:hypothetical protein